MTRTTTLYPAPAGIAPSDRYAVTVNGAVSFTYLTTGPAKAYYTAGHTASWTSFDVNGLCEVRIRRLSRPVSSAVVRPLAAGVQSRVEGGDVVLELERPRKLCVECDGDLTDVLFLFANAPETDVPSPDDSNVVWFGPGVHEIGKYCPLKPGTTYYLAPGAFLKGSFAGGGDGTRVIGRGVLSGADYDWPGDLQEKNPERVDLVKLAGDGLELAGITLVDSPYYVVIAGGKDNRFRDLKILAWHSNTDGISAGPGARIDNCFLRVADDAFKPFVSDTRISRCVLWVDKASVFQLTWNALRDSGGSEVRDCDVIHHMPFCTEDSEWVGAVFWSWHGGHAHIHDLLFEDIRIEGRSPCLLRLFMRRNPWSPQEGEWGRFSRLVFRNITCEQPFGFPSRLLGHDAEHPIADVTIENLTIAGRRIDFPAAMDLEINEFVRNLGFADHGGAACKSGRTDRTSIIFDGESPNRLACDTTLRRMPDGSWVMVMLGGGDFEPLPANQVFLTRSRDEGKTWEPLRPLDLGFPRQGDTSALCPSELMVNGNTCTLCVSTHDGNFAAWKAWLVVSEDAGRTWGKPVPAPGRLHERTFIRNHIVTRDSRILLPFQHYLRSLPPTPVFNGFGQVQVSAPVDPRNGILMSEDGGKTWTEQGDIRITDRDDYHGWAENNIVELADGRIAMIIRADGLGGVLYYAESTDGGRTWPEFARKTDILNPGSKATIYGLGGDTVALLHNPNPKHRSPLALWISEDGLKTWPYQRVLVPESCDGPNGWLNYPDGFVSAEKQWLHFAFDDNRHRAVYYGARLPPHAGEVP